MKKKIALIIVFTCMVAVFAGCNREIAFREFPGGEFTINTAGTFEFSGNYRGQIYIDAPRDAVVELVFNNFTLYNPAGSAIHSRRSERVEIVLTDGTVNNLTNRGGDYETVFVEHNLDITGGGTLNVTSHDSHALRSRDVLTVYGGTLNINSYGNALRGRNGVVVEDGIITAVAGSSGLRATRDMPFLGFVNINGGWLYITSQTNGINAEQSVTIDGGSVHIRARNDGISSGDSVNINGGDINILESVEGIEAQNIDIRGGSVDINAINDGLNARHATEEELGTIFIRMRGGDVTVSSQRDSIESDGNVYLEGGTIHLNGVPSGRPSGHLVFLGTEFVSTGNTVRASEFSTQRVIYASLGSHTAGALVELRDSDGNVRLSHTAQRAFSGSVAFSSAEISTLGTYYIYVNGALQHTATA